jgi:hypothetical protein
MHLLALLLKNFWITLAMAATSCMQCAHRNRQGRGEDRVVNLFPIVLAYMEYIVQIDI